MFSVILCRLVPAYHLGCRVHKGQDPIPTSDAEDRTHILATLHLGLDLIPHVLGTGPNPHYWAHATTTRARQTTTTIPFQPQLRAVKHLQLQRSFPACVCKRPDVASVHEHRVPGPLLMLGPTKTMSSRRVNVPAKRSTWVVSSTGTDRIPLQRVACCCQQCTSQTTTYAIPGVWHDDDAGGRDPYRFTQSIPWVWSEGPKPIFFLGQKPSP